jgi:phosphatidylglycerophosphatase A
MAYKQNKRKGLQTLAKIRMSAGEKVKVLLGSACYLGYVPLMPGTFGALPGIAIYYLLWKFFPSEFLWMGLFISVLLIGLLNYYLTPWATKYWKSKDPSKFVLDEIIGFMCVPLFYGTHDFAGTALWGFILFRVLDMIKIFPANYVDKHVKGSTGIIFDDVISAGYAALCLFILNYYNLI